MMPLKSGARFYLNEGCPAGSFDELVKVIQLQCFGGLSCHPPGVTACGSWWRHHVLKCQGRGCHFSIVAAHQMSVLMVTNVHMVVAPGGLNCHPPGRRLRQICFIILRVSAPGAVGSKNLMFFKSFLVQVTGP